MAAVRSMTAGKNLFPLPCLLVLKRGNVYVPCWEEINKEQGFVASISGEP